MENIANFNKKPLFKKQPILCPWVTSQPYPSTELIKNKLCEFLKKHGPGSTKKSTDTDQLDIGSNTYSPPPSSSTHFFYFLRLMQLFPDTHPATLHTVLTLSKHNFFFAIDKLLYAQKCKSDIRDRMGAFNGRGRSCLSENRGREPFPRPNQRFQTLSRPVSADLAEVQRIIDLTEKPYFGVQSEDKNIAEGEHQMMTNRVVKICVESTEQLVHGSQTFVDTENNEVIEIVCYDDDQGVLSQNKPADDTMEMDLINDDNLEPNMEEIKSNNAEEEPEPPVIVVDTVDDMEHEDCISEDSS